MTKVAYWRRNIRNWGAMWLVLTGIFAYAQNARIPGLPDAETISLPARSLNFSHFTAKKRVVDSTWLVHNPGMANHPDAGVLAAEQPDSNAIEILSKRTENSRYYVDSKIPGRVFSQSAYGSLHYKKDENWLLIDRRLDRKNDQILEASHQIEPVGFDLTKQESYIKSKPGTLTFNNWKLYGLNGKEKKLLAAADWKNYQAGDDGLLISDIFPGIDAQMKVERGEIKTSFIVQKWMFTGYETYFFEDTFSHPNGVSLKFENASQQKNGVGKLGLWVGEKKAASIGKAYAFSSGKPELSVDLPYQIQGGKQAIVLNKNVLAAMLEAGPFVIDPTVTGAASQLAQNAPLNSHFDGDMNNCTENRFAESCSYKWKLNVPGAITVSKLYFDARIETLAPCIRENMFYKYIVGSGSVGSRVIWSSVGEELDKPGISFAKHSESQHYNQAIEPTCDPSQIDIRLSIMRKCMGAVGCGADCVRGIGPFVVTVEGETLRASYVLPSLETEICNGEEVILSTKAAFGIAGTGYKYLWSPGGHTGESVTVKPEKTTTYSVTLSDVCGQVTEKVAVKVLSGPVKKESKKLTDCGKVTFEGVEYTESIVLGDTLKTVFGCDSVIRETRIEVFPEKALDESIDMTGCEFVEYNGLRYTQDTVVNEDYKNANGCDSLRRVVNIRILPLETELLASSKPESVFLGEKVTLTPKFNRDSYKVISWDPAALFEDPHAPKQTVVVNQDATYTVHIESEDGCSGSASVRLMGKEVPGSTLYPSSFTPNGDGVNDVWQPIRNAEELEVWVYSRWGEVVYHAKGSNQSWDGTYKGKPLAAGTYTYRLLVHGRYDYRGMVNLIY